MASDRELNEQFPEEAARLRALFEERARHSAEAEMIFRCGAIDNAVEEALNIGSVTEGPMKDVGDVIRDYDIDGAEKVAKHVYYALGDAKQRAAAARDSDAVAHYFYAECHTAWCIAALTCSRSPREARHWYHRAKDVRPPNFWLLTEAARIENWVGEAQIAQEMLFEAIKLDPDVEESVRACDDFAEIYVEKGEYGEALEFYDGVVRRMLETVAESENDGELDGLDVWARQRLMHVHEMMARCHDAQGDVARTVEARKAAADVAKSLFQADPDDFLYRKACAGQLVNYAVSLRGADAFEEAMAAYRDALACIGDRFETDFLAWNLVSLIHEGIGDIEDEWGNAEAARDAWERCRVTLTSLLHAANRDETAAAARQMATQRLAEMGDRLT